MTDASTTIPGVPPTADNDDQQQPKYQKTFRQEGLIVLFLLMAAVNIKLFFFTAPAEVASFTGIYGTMMTVIPSLMAAIWGSHLYQFIKAPDTMKS